MYLADARGCNEVNWFRRYNTFTSGNDGTEYADAFDDLYLLNDYTLAGGRSVSVNVDESSYVILLPVVGAMAMKVDPGCQVIIEPGRLHIVYLPKGDRIGLSNPYEADLVNFIQLSIKAGAACGDTFRQITFNLDKNKNNLIDLIKGSGNEGDLPRISIGKFSGRSEAFYKLRSKENKVFTFIIEGVFEVQERLLHPRDGLGLWDVPGDIELEALSNDAILLIIEM